MRFLYVAPRYHTNQIPIMKGLIENGHEVRFFGHYAGRIEDYAYVKPEIIGYSFLYRIYDFLYVKILHAKDKGAADKKLLRGFPPVLRLDRRMRAYRPDLVVIRERSVYSMVTYLLCRLHGYRAVLYNQSPVYEEIRDDLAHRLVRRLTPKARMTPVMGSPGKGKEKAPGTFFVPFVMDLQRAPQDRTYVRDGVVHIFTVGKYEKRKNLLMMVETVGELAGKYPVYLTIAGECSTQFHRDYYRSVEACVLEHRLAGKVTLLQNLSRDEMSREYEKADLFVLPSTLEPASISQLEAMAFSVPVICSDTNGSACYVEEGRNGFLFRDNDRKDLKEKLEKVLQSPLDLRELGRNAYEDVKEKYQFDNYLKGIMECAQWKA